MEITKMLTLSTIHIKPETAKLLSEICEYGEYFSLALYPKRWINDCYGYFIYVPEELETDSDAYKDIPEDLMKCLLFARDLNCGILCLDEDGEVFDYLNKYNW